MATGAADAWSDDDGNDDGAVVTSEHENESYDAFQEKPLPGPFRGRPAEKGFSYVFIIDRSASMRENDVTSANGANIRRIDAVLAACTEFMQQQMQQTATEGSCSGLDTFSVGFFSDEHQWLFAMESIEVALEKLTSGVRTKAAKHTMLIPGGGTHYLAGLESVDESIANGQALKIMFLSDGRPADWNQKRLDWFQDEWLTKFGPGAIELHCIGFGPPSSEFRVLQQMAQLAGGSFSVARLDICDLRRTLSSITSTQTLVQPCQSTRFLESQIRLMPPGWWNQVKDDWLTTRRQACFKATSHRYVWNPESGISLLDTIECIIKLAPRPFARGGMRYAYEMCEKRLRPTRKECHGRHGSWLSDSEDEEETLHMIAKKFVRPMDNSSRDAHMAHVKSSCVAGYFAEKFCAATGQSITVVPCYLYTVQDATTNANYCFCGEDFVPGAFVKWISNGGDILQDSDVPSALAHYSWILSNGELGICDIQGVCDADGNYVMFDLQVASISLRSGYGRADLGLRTKQKFFETHRCNIFCQKLGIAADADGVLVIRFGSSPGGGSDGWSKFRDLLLNGPHLRTCRETLERSGFSCELPGGALMFVKPEQVTRVKHATSDKKLCRYHVVVASDWETNLEDARASLPFKKRPRQKPGTYGRVGLDEFLVYDVDLPPSSSSSTGRAAVDEDCPAVEVIERTFLSFKPRLLARQSVVQSTTEAVNPHSAHHFAHKRGTNPRRHV